MIRTEIIHFLKYTHIYNGLYSCSNLNLTHNPIKIKNQIVMAENLLIIFVKNPVAGEVKTRLAASIGDMNALQVYKSLLSHTRNVASGAEADRQVWYSSKIDRRDAWESNLFEKELQSGSNLGERMGNAFSRSFEQGYKRVVIIGSDCAELTSEHIEEAFHLLESHDAVIGPSEDGGYYLLGLTQFHPEIFSDVEWSTSSVLARTIEKFEESHTSYRQLETLNDIDNEEDFKKSELTLPNVD